LGHAGGKHTFWRNKFSEKVSEKIMPNLNLFRLSFPKLQDFIQSGHTDAEAISCRSSSFVASHLNTWHH
jgi:hypothetical protein